MPVVNTMGKSQRPSYISDRNGKTNIEIAVARWGKDDPNFEEVERGDKLLRHMTRINLTGISLSGIGQGLVDGFEAMSI